MNLKVSPEGEGFTPIVVTIKKDALTQEVSGLKGRAAKAQGAALGYRFE
jgi:hypothetical protein